MRACLPRFACWRCWAVTPPSPKPPKPAALTVFNNPKGQSLGTAPASHTLKLPASHLLFMGKPASAAAALPHYTLRIADIEVPMHRSAQVKTFTATGARSPGVLVDTHVSRERFGPAAGEARGSNWAADERLRRGSDGAQWPTTPVGRRRL